MLTPGRVLFALFLLLPGATWAQDADTAASLQSQLRAWFASWPGTGPLRPDPSLRVLAEDDYYRIEWPLAAADQPASDFSANLRLSPDGRWLLDTPRLTPGTIAFSLPSPSRDAAGPTQMSLTLARQQGHAEIDPTFATPSALSLEVNSLRSVSDNAITHQSQTFNDYTIHARLVPGANGRVDFDTDNTAQGWHGTARTQHGLDVDYSAKTMHGDLHVANVSREAVTAAASAVTALVPLLPAQSDRGQPMDPARAALLRHGLRALLEALRDSLTGITSNGGFDDVSFTVAGGSPVSVRDVSMAMEGSAPDGRLQASLDLVLSGITSAGTPPDLADLLPADIALRPSISGIDMAGLTRLAMDATAEAPNQPAIEAEAHALWSDPAAAFALDALRIALGPALLEGSAHVHADASGQPDVEAHLSATGFDTLMTLAAKKPSLQRALPLLIMAQGMAKPEGNRLVWDITAHDGHVLVNGIDLKALGGGATRPASGLK